MKILRFTIWVGLKHDTFFRSLKNTLYSWVTSVCKMKAGFWLQASLSHTGIAASWPGTFQACERHCTSSAGGLSMLLDYLSCCRQVSIISLGWNRAAVKYNHEKTENFTQSPIEKFFKTLSWHYLTYTQKWPVGSLWSWDSSTFLDTMMSFQRWNKRSSSNLLLSS